MSAAAENDDTPALPIIGGPKPSKTVVRKRATRTEPAPVTSTGENSADILGAWIKWNQDITGVPVPGTITARMGKQIRSLIVSGFTTTEIKHGLSFWSTMQWDRRNYPPTELDTLVWGYARDTRADAEEWRRRMRERRDQFQKMGQMGGGSSSKRQQRQDRSMSNIEAWMQKQSGE